MAEATLNSGKTGSWLDSEPVKFILKVLAIYIVWYLVYEMWLLPDGTLDHWIAVNIVDTTAGILTLFSYDVFTAGRLIGLDTAPGILLVDGCTGISAIGLFIGFIIAYPGKWIPRLSFIIIGIGIIYLVNIIRIAALAITQVQWPEFFDFTHDYSTTAIFYMVIFVLWILWANLGDSNESRSP
ncbi:exosortase X [Halalkalibaculum sp. DA3122]|uniref:exosortase X n=1 Tax=unclassified Halalkalibaculum TaxID=2964617 RepID=UPI0037541434